MNRKLFGILLVVTVVTTLALLLSSGSRDDHPAPARGLLVPGFPDAANDLQAFEIVAPGNRAVATLERRDERWVVAEADGYVADWDTVRGVLAALAQAEIAETKTSNPDYYHRLGVQDIASADARGVLVRFPGTTELPAIIIGNAAQGREGQYARLQDDVQSVLLDRELEVPRETKDWLETTIVDISSDEIVEVNISHPDGESVRISRISVDDGDFTLDGIPDGKEIKSNWTVNSLAGALGSLNLDAVTRHSGSLPDSVVHYQAIAADGLKVDAFWYELDEAGETSAWVVIEPGLLDAESAASETVARADEIRQRVEGWAYRVTDYKFDAATKRLDDLLNDSPPEDAAEGSGS